MVSVSKPPKLRRETPETLRIRLLGGFEVLVGRVNIKESEWRLRKAASLIKLLVLSSGHRMHTEQIIELLWPELPHKAAANNLRYALHIARRRLEPSSSRVLASGYLRRCGGMLSLCPETPLWVDVEAFEDAAATAGSSRELGAYRAAIELYAGELLPEDRYEEWAEDRREELRRTYLCLLVELANLYEARGEFELAIEALKKAVSDEPTDEEVNVGLMRLYALIGQKEKALEQFERLRRTLLREFGREPGPASLHLYSQQKIPSQEESLSNGRPSSLTRREEEVALLVARGLTNKQISSELSISIRTVENHVAKILKKLGFRCRTQIGTWVMGHGLLR